VTALRKPALPVWAINQLARRDAGRVGELLGAGEQLLAAQRDALAGKGTERFEEAGKRQRDAIRALVAAAVRLLSEAGNRPGPAVEERIASSLRAASVDPEVRPLLERGRLDDEVESSGLDLLAGIAPPARGRAAPARPKGPSREERSREAREALKAARETERERRKEASAAEREAKAAAEAADAAAARARDLTEQAEAAAEAVAEAEAELERLRGSR
jgi:hypothetical protein